MTNLELAKELYSLKNIQKAQADYSSLAHIILHEEVRFWKLSFDRCRFQENITVCEFENYLIGLENQNGPH